MQKYTVTQGFHLGEICQDIIKGTEISFDESAGKLYLGSAEFSVRVSPIVGAIKKGWLRATDTEGLIQPEVVRFDGVEESMPISSDKAPQVKEKKKIEQIVYEEDIQALDGSEPQKSEKSEGVKIGFENREDDKSSISFDNLKSLKNLKDSHIIDTWDLSKHWATRKKEMLQINNINTLMKIAAIDKTLKSHIEARIKEISPLGKEITDVSEITEGDLEKKPVKSKTQKPEKQTKKSKKAEKPNMPPMGKDFDEYMGEQVASGKVQIPKSKQREP